MRKTISQREARRLQRRVAELENAFTAQRLAWSGTYMGATHIGSEQLITSNVAALKTARLLGHAVVLVPGTGDSALLMALPHYKERV